MARPSSSASRSLHHGPCTIVGGILEFLGLAGSGCRANLKDFPGGRLLMQDSPMQLTGSNPVPHDHQKGAQLHSGSSALPGRVQASGQCLEAHVLGALSCHSLQVGQEVGYSHSAWDRAWWGRLDWTLVWEQLPVIHGLVTCLPHSMQRDLGKFRPGVKFSVHLRVNQRG